MGAAAAIAGTVVSPLSLPLDEDLDEEEGDDNDDWRAPSPAAAV